VLIRISGEWGRITKEVKAILNKVKLQKMYSAIILRYDLETYKLINLIEAYITWG